MPAPVAAATAGKAVLAFLARAWPFLLGAALLVAGLVGIDRLLDARAAKDKAAATIATAAPKAAQEAHAELDRVIERERTIEKEVIRDIQIIQSAPDANQSASDDLFIAFNRGLCARASYGYDLECPEVLGIRAPDAGEAGGRRAAAGE